MSTGHWAAKIVLPSGRNRVDMYLAPMAIKIVKATKAAVKVRFERLITLWS